MYLNVTFEGGESREIPVSTAHVLELKDHTGTIDSFALGGVESVLLVLDTPPPAPAKRTRASKGDGGAA